MMPLIARTSLAALFLLTLWGCPAASENNTTEDMTSQPDTSGEVDMCGTNCGAPDMSGDFTPPDPYAATYQLRFDALAFTNTREVVFRVLNGLLMDSFDQTMAFPVVILLDIKDLDAGAGTFSFRAGAGLKTDTEGEYDWDPETDETYAPGMLTADTGAFSGAIDRFIFVATFETETEPERTELPLNELEFTGNLAVNASDEVTIPNGLLSGHITKTEADSTMIVIPGSMPQPLTGVLGEENINFDSDGDGTDDAWLLEATFSAIPTVINN